MQPSIVIHQLRTRALYPVLKGNRIRLYGDMRRLTDGLRQAVTMNRAGIIEQLQQPAESIAYDLVDIASCAGWHPTVNGQAVTWRCGAQQSSNPMPTESLRDAFTHHTADVVHVLLQVPAGCPNRSTCEVQGICAAEIGESACTALAGKASPHE